MLALPLTISVPANVELLLRKFTPLPGFVALIVQVPEPFKPPSKKNPSVLVVVALLVRLMVVEPEAVTVPSRTTQFAGLTSSRVPPLVSAMLSALLLFCTLVVPLHDSRPPAAIVVGEL